MKKTLFSSVLLLVLMNVSLACAGSGSIPSRQGSEMMEELSSATSPAKAQWVSTSLVNSPLNNFTDGYQRLTVDNLKTQTDSNLDLYLVIDESNSLKRSYAGKDVEENSCDPERLRYYLPYFLARLSAHFADQDGSTGPRISVLFCKNRDDCQEGFTPLKNAFVVSGGTNPFFSLKDRLEKNEVDLPEGLMGGKGGFQSIPKVVEKFLQESSENGRTKALIIFSDGYLGTEDRSKTIDINAQKKVMDDYLDILTFPGVTGKIYNVLLCSDQLNAEHREWYRKFKNDTNGRVKIYGLESFYPNGSDTLDLSRVENEVRRMINDLFEPGMFKDYGWTVFQRVAGNKEINLSSLPRDTLRIAPYFLPVFAAVNQMDTWVESRLHPSECIEIPQRLPIGNLNQGIYYYSWNIARYDPHIRLLTNDKIKSVNNDGVTIEAQIDNTSGESWDNLSRCYMPGITFDCKQEIKSIFSKSPVDEDTWKVSWQLDQQFSVPEPSFKKEIKYSLTLGKNPTQEASGTIELSYSPEFSKMGVCSYTNQKLDSGCQASLEGSPDILRQFNAGNNKIWTVWIQLNYFGDQYFPLTSSLLNPHIKFMDVKSQNQVCNDLESLRFNGDGLQDDQRNGFITAYTRQDKYVLIYLLRKSQGNCDAFKIIWEDAQEIKEIGPIQLNYKNDLTITMEAK